MRSSIEIKTFKTVFSPTRLLEVVWLLITTFNHFKQQAKCWAGYGLSLWRAYPGHSADGVPGVQGSKTGKDVTNILVNHPFFLNQLAQWLEHDFLSGSTLHYYQLSKEFEHAMIPGTKMALQIYGVSHLYVYPFKVTADVWAWHNIILCCFNNMSRFAGKSSRQLIPKHTRFRDISHQSTLCLKCQFEHQFSTGSWINIYQIPPVLVLVM